MPHIAHSSPEQLRPLFSLRPEVVFLNHGSFGAAPTPVMAAYRAWQRDLEAQPVEFLARRAKSLLKAARSMLADHLGCQASELVYLSNPTTAVNTIARSLDLKTGDEILTSDHEYGAIDRTWKFICRATGASYIRAPIRVPVTSRQDIIEQLWSRVNQRTRLVQISHITSQTALIFPAAEICRRARDAGLLTLVDGAHAPGQLPLDLSELGADFYTGACHKWLCGPKGSAFLYARPEVQELLDPLVVSWGYDPQEPGESQFLDHHEWQGTRDISAFLAVPQAIEFQRRHAWESVRARCREMLSAARERLLRIAGTRALCPDSPDWFMQMAAVELPVGCDPERVQARLYRNHRIEVPVYQWQDRALLRVSVQGYNRPEDLEALIEALPQVF